MSLKLCVDIMTPERMSAAYFINSSSQPVSSICLSPILPRHGARRNPLIVAAQRLRKTYLRNFL
jgi:hypothetical protein